MHINILGMITQADFAQAVESCIAATGMTPTTFGKEALGDPTFVFELRRGRSCGLKTVDRVMAFIEAQGPQGKAA